MSNLRCCRAVKFDSWNNLWSSILRGLLCFVIILRSTEQPGDFSLYLFYWKNSNLWCQYHSTPQTQCYKTDADSLTVPVWHPISVVHIAQPFSAKGQYSMFRPLPSILRGKSKFGERRQSWGLGSGSPRILGWGGSRRGRRGSQNIIISYNVQEYGENTEHGSKTFGKNRIIILYTM